MAGGALSKGKGGNAGVIALGEGLLVFVHEGLEGGREDAAAVVGAALLALFGCGVLRGGPVAGGFAGNPESADPGQLPGACGFDDRAKPLRACASS